MDLLRLCLNFIQVAVVTKKITNDCGILSLLEPGHCTMTDRGFDVEDELPPDLMYPHFYEEMPNLN